MTLESLTKAQQRAQHGRPADGFRSLSPRPPPVSNARTHRLTIDSPPACTAQRNRLCMAESPGYGLHANTAPQPRLKAGAERTLAGVGCNTPCPDGQSPQQTQGRLVI